MKNELQGLSDKAVLIALSPKESSLVGLLRAKKYSKIEIHLQDDEITQVYGEEEIATSGANVVEIMNSTAYQTVTIAKHDGDFVRIKRRTPIKLQGEASQAQARRKKH